MTAIASQKAFLYETSGSAKGPRERKSLDYKLEGRHATFMQRGSASFKGKFSLSVGKKLDFTREKESKEHEEDKKCKQIDTKPVVLPKCREDTFTEVMEDDESRTQLTLMRENTDDVPLTTELLHNDLSHVEPPALCLECAKVGRYTKHEHFKRAIFNADDNSKPCVICEKRKLKKKNVKDEKTLLMSIVYPHDFYDRYQNARRHVHTPSDDGEKRPREKKKKGTQQKMVLPKTNFTLPETINEGDKVILKPHVVKFKERLPKENFHNMTHAEGETEPNNTSLLPQFPTLTSPTSPQVKPKHLRCQPQMKAYFVASLSSSGILKDRFSFFGQKRSLRGSLLSKSEKFEKTKISDMKHSFINVGSLGLTIGIPEYNEKLGNRQTTTNNYLSRTFNTLANMNRPHSMRLPPVKSKIRPPGSIGHRSM